MDPNQWMNTGAAGMLAYLVWWATAKAFPALLERLEGMEEGLRRIELRMALQAPEGTRKELVDSASAKAVTV